MSVIVGIAAVIQALTAVAIVFLTKRLSEATAKYTELTAKIAEVNAKQLRAHMYPVIDITNAFMAVSTGTTAGIGIRINVSNRGETPVKLFSVSGVALKNGKPVGRGSIESLRNAVAMPGKAYEEWAQIELPSDVKGSECQVYSTVDCTDLAEVSEHSFVLDPDGTLRHFLGFRHGAI